MKKKYYIAIGTVLIGLFLLAAPFSKVSRFLGIRDGFNVTIYNNTNYEINGLKITYHHITKDIEVPMIEPGGKTTLNIIPKEHFNENQMKIKYENSNGNKQDIVIVGYFEKGYSGVITIKVSSKDSGGFLDFDVHENTTIY